MKPIPGLLDVLCLIIAMGVILYANTSIKSANNGLIREDEEIRLSQNAMLTVGFVIWPPIWDAIIGYDKLIENPRMIAGFMWPLVLCLFDMQYVKDFRSGSSADKISSAEFDQKNLSSDTQAIISVAFAMGSLYFSSSKNANTTHLIMLALVFCLAIVLPNLQAPAESKESVLWRSAQRIGLNFAVGFSISGISLDLLKGMFKEGLEKMDVIEIAQENVLQPKKPKLVFKEL